MSVFKPSWLLPFLLMFSILHALPVQGQSKQDVKPIPNIIFSKAWLLDDERWQHEKVTPVKQLNEISLGQSKNLYFSAKLPKPLLLLLRDLAPNQSDHELLKKGNFLFEFFVNGESVYIEKLNIGAGTQQEKTQALLLSKPLFSEANEDSWGRFLWMRFMHFGGEQALRYGSNKVTMNIATYYEGDTLKTSGVLASGEITINLIKLSANEQQIAIQEIQNNSGWQVSPADYNKTAIRALNKKIAEKEFKDINAIVVIKNGQLLIEQYYNGSTRETLHNPRSVGKSFASTMLGIAIQNGHIKSAEKALGDFYSLQNYRHYSLKKETVSLESLLTMSSGFEADDSDFNSVGNEEKMYPTDDWVKFALDLPMHADESSIRWRYFTAGIVVLGDILNQTLPGGLEQYADKTLFSPLGIKSYQWQYTPTGVANTAGGLALRAIDFAKYGQLYKNGGVWKKQRILSKEWVEKSLSPLVQRGEKPQDGHYGYLFWHDIFPFKNKMIEVAYATGNGGNKVYIFKNIDLVVVVNASAYNRPYAHPQVNKIMAEYLLPAVL